MTKQASAALRRLMPVPVAAQTIGMSERWLRTQIAAGSIPVVCFGRRRLIRREDLDLFIEARVRQSAGADTPKPERGCRA